MTWLPDPSAEYDERLAGARARLARGERLHLHLSNARLLIAAAAAVLAWAVFGRPGVSGWWLAAPVAAFAAVAVVHGAHLRRMDRVRRVARFYESGLARIDDRWQGGGRGGDRFAAADHPYARDLDLFGTASLFELLNTTRTEAGEETLADWLLAPAAPAEVRARQAACAELGSRVDFREDVAVLAAEAHVARTGALVEWARTPPVGLPNWVGALFAVSGIVTAALVAAAFAERVDESVAIGWLLVQLVIAWVWRGRVLTVLSRIAVPAHDLELVAGLLTRIEREPFGAERLAALQGELRHVALPSKRIARLQQLVSLLDSTTNQIFAPIAAGLLVRSQMAVAIDRWHRTSGPDVAVWLRAVGELEALAALATYSYEHPADPFPEIVGAPGDAGQDPAPAASAGALFAGTRIGHPLLPARTAIRNDVALGGDAPGVLIVSGSNMSGKSTLLRAVGVNVVLALAGAPVRATSLRLSPLSIGATLRVEDSLQEGRSRFYAEILRIRAVIDLTRGSVPVLFLLDEILHGTNSYDRRIGAEAIVRSLVERNAIGLVTTHDLALTELASNMGPRAANVHFEDRLEKGVMVFDYRMRPGVVEHSNALALMRAVGLDV